MLLTVCLSQDFVFKSNRYSALSLEWLNNTQKLAISCGFVVPELCRSLNGRLIEGGWTCEPLIPGRAFSQSDMPSILDQIVNFHGLTASVPQRPGFLSSQDLLTCDKGGDIKLGLMPDDIVTACRKSWKLISDYPDAVVHGDLNPSNLIRCTDGRDALVDWDECLRGKTIFDIGHLQSEGAVGRRALIAWGAACSWQIEPITPNGSPEIFWTKPS